jgi:uncharacterized protein with gpF-like domain
MNKAEYIRRWDRFQKRYERIYTTKFKAALQEQVRQHLEIGYINSQPIYEVLVDLYKTVGPLWAFNTGVHRFKRQTKARLPMGFSERIVELMRQYYGIDLLNDAEGITEYTREVIQDVLGAAATSGISFDEIVKQLETSTELSAMRARRIARTEVVSAANAASLINAQETDVPMVKIWLAVDDKRTRRSHRFVDDQTVPLDTPFNVGGVEMMQPGVRQQPNGLPTPANEVVNCRCVLGYRVIEE